MLTANLNENSKLGSVHFTFLTHSQLCAPGICNYIFHHQENQIQLYCSNLKDNKDTIINFKSCP